MNSGVKLVFFRILIVREVVVSSFEQQAFERS